MKSKMTDVEAMNMVMPFGRDTHEGKTLEEIPSGYLNWVEEQDWAEERYPKLIEAIGKVLRWRTLHDEHF